MKKLTHVVILKFLVDKGFRHLIVEILHGDRKLI